MQQGGNPRLLLALLGAFPPSDWREELYIRSPPFAFFQTPGGVLLRPYGTSTTAILDELSPLLGLKKRVDIEAYYVTGRSDTIRAIRRFRWFVRRSWRGRKFSVLWAIIYIAQRAGWSNLRIPLESVEEMTGCDPVACRKIAEELLGSSAVSQPAHGFRTFLTEREQILRALSELTREIPSWTEEQVMATLCLRTGASVNEVHEHISSRGSSLDTVYKAVERLKRSGHVYPGKHVRVKDRGPMREILSPSCRNCFFGFSSQERCLQDALRQLEDVIQRHYGKSITSENRESLYSSIRSMPFGSRLIRRLLEALTLVFQVESTIGERAIVSMIRKLEEAYDLELPVKRPSDYPETEAPLV